MNENFPDYRSIPTYTRDRRPSPHELFTKLHRLKSIYGFEIEAIYSAATERNSRRSKRITAYAYKSRRTGPAIWLLAGIHGEEPAGPIAFAENADYLGRLGQRIPMVIAALLNPLGNSRDYRYLREHRAWLRGQNSISDSSHFLPQPLDPLQPRRATPISRVAAEITSFVLKTMTKYPPVFAADLHEDETTPRKYRSYIYSQGPMGNRDILAQAVIAMLKQGQLPPVDSGLTVSDETIVGGIVVHRRHQPIQDGSIDELFGSPTIIANGQAISKPPASTVLVLETPIIGVPLGERVQVHSNFISRLLDLWELLRHPLRLKT